MQSLLTQARNFLTPTQSTTNLQDTGKFRTEKAAEALFQRVDPLIDGEDCLHDCASCTETLPRKWSIDEDDKLYGHVKGWETHLVVGTGKSDWVRDVTDEKGSLMQAVGQLGLQLSNGKLMLSASNMPSSADHGHAHGNGGKHAEYENEGRTRCLLLPRWQVVDGVGIQEAKWLLEEVVSKSSTNSSLLPKQAVKSAPHAESFTAQEATNGELAVQKEPELEDMPPIDGLTMTNTASSVSKPSANGGTLTNQATSMSNPFINGQAQSTTSTIPPGVTMRPLHHRAIILMCSHGTRDWRCGKSAPILKREFERHLRPLGLYRDFDDDRPGGVGVYFINHVGGHKYSANVMIYRRQGRTAENGTEGAAAEEEDDDDDWKRAHLSDEAVQGIWLARVRPEDCENIVKYTVLQGKVVKPQRQLRGGFDRERGLLSW